MIKKSFFIDDSNVKKHVNDMSRFIVSKCLDADRDGVILGMSGGIDCSVVARLAQEAGVDTKLVMMPDGKSMNNDSMVDSMALINKFGFKHSTVDIKPACDAIEQSILAGDCKKLTDFTRSNIRPRVRMTTLYAIAQDERRFVIGTSNLDERLIGYFTKYGDGGSDLNPLGLVTKGEVRTLAKYLGVPQNIITKAPSAGLGEDQTDEKDLGFSYEQMDNFIYHGTSGNPRIDQLINRRIAMSEHKLALPPIYTGGTLDL